MARKVLPKRGRKSLVFNDLRRRAARRRKSLMVNDLRWCRDYFVNAFSGWPIAFAAFVIYIFHQTINQTFFCPVESFFFKGWIFSPVRFSVTIFLFHNL